MRNLFFRTQIVTTNQGPVCIASFLMYYIFRLISADNDTTKIKKQSLSIVVVDSKGGYDIITIIII